MAKLRQTSHSKAIRRERLEFCRGRCEAGAWVQSSGSGWQRVERFERCTVMHNDPDPLECHHVHYQRAGHELLDDVRMYCKRHHDLVESEVRPWNQNRRRGA